MSEIRNPIPEFNETEQLSEELRTVIDRLMIDFKVFNLFQKTEEKSGKISNLKKRKILIVEGEADRKFYSRFINNNIGIYQLDSTDHILSAEDEIDLVFRNSNFTVQETSKTPIVKDTIISIISRCAKFEKLHSAFTTKVFFGIVDRDFDFNESDIKDICKLTTSEYDLTKNYLKTTQPACDVESLIFSCSEKYISNKYGKQKLDKVKDKASKLSVLWKTNYDNIRKGNNKTLYLKEFMKTLYKDYSLISEKDELSFIIDKLKELKKPNNQIDISYWEKIILNSNYTNNSIQNCRGHDLTKIMAILTNIKEKSIIKDILANVSLSDYEETEIYKFIEYISNYNTSLIELEKEEEIS